MRQLTAYTAPTRPRLYSKSLKLLNFADPDPVLAALHHQAPAQQGGIMAGASRVWEQDSDPYHFNADPNPAFSL